MSTGEKFLVAFLIIILLIFIIGLPVGYYYYYDRSNTSNYSYTAQAPASVWDPSKPGDYSCPSGYTSQETGFCVLPEAQARDACSSDSKCMGYLKPGSTSPWGTKFSSVQNPVQLTPTAPTSNTSWPGAVYYPKQKILK